MKIIKDNWMNSPKLMGVVIVAMDGSSNRIWEAFHGPNMGYVEEQYELFLDDPDAVDESLRHIFEQYGAPEWMDADDGGQVAPQSGGATSFTDLKKLTSAMKLVEAIRRHGHLGCRYLSSWRS